MSATRTAAAKRNGRPRPSARRPRRGSAIGDEIIAGLAEVLASLEAGEPLNHRFTVRTYTLPDEPAAYDAAAVQALRGRVGASQALFAQLLCVSTKLVQAWERGDRVPAGPARRLLDLIAGDVDRWAAMYRPVVSGPAIGRHVKRTAGTATGHSRRKVVNPLRTWAMAGAN